MLKHILAQDEEKKKKKKIKEKEEYENKKRNKQEGRLKESRNKGDEETEGRKTVENELQEKNGVNERNGLNTNVNKLTNTDHGMASDNEEGDNVDKMEGFQRSRRPSWLSESHPRIVFNDRQKFREEIKRESELSINGDSGSDDDVDDIDMQYGLDPGFADLDEELRVCEGMIEEHTVLKEVVDDDDDDEDEQSDDEKIIVKTIDDDNKILEKDQHIQKLTDIEKSIESIAISSETDDDEKMSSNTKEKNNQKKVTPPKVDTKPRRVRLVELPDYLAMVAREHQRQLLEKRKRDLALAAEAANAREGNGNPVSSVGPRSQNRIRRGYFDRLGIAGDFAPISPTSSVNAAKRLDMGINARRAAIASARTRRRPPSERIKISDPVTSSKGKGFFKKLTSWMVSDTDDDSDSTPVSSSPIRERTLSISPPRNVSTVSSRPQPSSYQSGGESPSKKEGICFFDTVDVYYIPARTDYPSKVRNSIWHTRAEFVEMVMRNMDQLELEMHQEAEAQRRLQDLKDNPPPNRRPAASPASS